MRITEKYRIANNAKGFKSNDPLFDNYLALLQAIFLDETPSLTHLLDKEEAEKRLQFLDENFYKKKEQPPLRKWWDNLNNTDNKKEKNKSNKYRADLPVIVRNLETGKELKYNTRKELCEVMNIDLISLNYYIRYGLCKDKKYMFFDLHNQISCKGEYHTNKVLVENLVTGEEYEFINFKKACAELDIKYRRFSMKRHNNPTATELKVGDYLFKNLPKIRGTKSKGDIKK